MEVSDPTAQLRLFSALKLHCVGSDNTIASDPTLPSNRIRQLIKEAVGSDMWGRPFVSDPTFVGGQSNTSENDSDGVFSDTEMSKLLPFILPQMVGVGWQTIVRDCCR